MSPSTIIGIFGGIALVVISIWATARDALVFISFPGLLIVLGGTIAAIMVSFPSA